MLIMKRKIIVLIDGENVSYKKAEEIKTVIKNLGNVTECKVYHLQKDQATRYWTKIFNDGIYKDICLFGKPEKNKVDFKIQKDAKGYLNAPEVRGVCVVTSDSGFRCLAIDAAIAGKKLYFIGEKKASEKLRRAGAKFFELA